MKFNLQFFELSSKFFSVKSANASTSSSTSSSTPNLKQSKENFPR